MFVDFATYNNIIDYFNLIKMNKTFEDIINALQKDNNLRDFNFDLVLEYMEKNEIPQHLK